MTDPTEALYIGAGVVAESAKGLPRRLRGNAADRAHVALEIAKFLVGHGDAEEADEEPKEDDGTRTPEEATEAVPVGPVRKVLCAVSPGDFAFTRAHRPPNGRPFVGVEVETSGSRAQVVLSPASARAYAAGILDAADEAEGGSPLLHFVKPDA